MGPEELFTQPLCAAASVFALQGVPQLEGLSVRSGAQTGRAGAWRLGEQRLLYVRSISSVLCCMSILQD